jgi:hypothetical protein
MFSQSSKFTNSMRRKTHNKIVKSVGNKVLYAGLLMTLLGCSFATFQVIYPFIISSVSAATNTSFQPTSIPWLEDKSNCQYTGRSWHENKCWDNEHSPTF